MMGVVQYLFVLLAYIHVSQVACEWSCCDKRTAKFFMNNGTYISTEPLEDMGIDIVQNFTNGPDDGCDWRIVLKVRFDDPVNCTDECTLSCHRRMLKIRMKIDSNRSDWLFHAGNSPTNDGTKSDANTHTYDSNMAMFNEDLTVHSNDNCNISTEYINATASVVTVRIASGYYRIRNNMGLDEAVCNKKCFFDFFGKNDAQFSGQNDFFLFVGFNRLIDPGVARIIGKGVCGARLSWECCEMDQGPPVVTQVTAVPKQP